MVLTSRAGLPAIHVDEKVRDGVDFLFWFGDDFRSRPRSPAAVGRTGTLLIVARSVREAPLK